LQNRLLAQVKSQRSINRFRILHGRLSCDDPAVKWAESPLTAPEKPIVPERV
jgi:hypothetical protein